MKKPTAKKANRGHLKRAAKKGQLYVKCSFRYTDDYAWDDAVNFGKMDEYVRVYFKSEEITPEIDALEGQINDLFTAVHPNMPDVAVMEPLREKLGFLRRALVAVEDEKAKGMIKMSAWEFTGKSGHMVGDTKEGYFNVHSNLSYEYQIRA